MSVGTATDVGVVWTLWALAAWLTLKSVALVGAIVYRLRDQGTPEAAPPRL